MYIDISCCRVPQIEELDAHVPVPCTLHSGGQVPRFGPCEREAETGRGRERDATLD